MRQIGFGFLVLAAVLIVASAQKAMSASSAAQVLQASNGLNQLTSCNQGDIGDDVADIDTAFAKCNAWAKNQKRKPSSPTTTTDNKNNDTDADDDAAIPGSFWTGPIPQPPIADADTVKEIKKKLSECQNLYESHGGVDCPNMPIDDDPDADTDDQGNTPKIYLTDRPRSAKCKAQDATVLRQKSSDDFQTMNDAEDKMLKAQEKLMDAQSKETENEGALMKEITDIQPTLQNNLLKMQQELTAQQQQAKNTINETLRQVNDSSDRIQSIEREGATLREKFIKDKANLKLACEQNAMNSQPAGGYTVNSLNQLTNAQSVGGLRVYKCMRDIKNRRGPEADLEAKYERDMNSLISEENQERNKIVSLNNSIKIGNDTLAKSQQLAQQQVNTMTQKASADTQRLNQQLQQMMTTSTQNKNQLSAQVQNDQKLYDQAKQEYDFSHKGYQALQSQGYVGKTPTDDSSSDSKDGDSTGVLLRKALIGVNYLDKPTTQWCESDSNVSAQSSGKSPLPPAATTGGSGGSIGGTAGNCDPSKGHCPANVGGSTP